MAMTNCKECKKEVSSTAKVCPHCGIKNPGVGALQMFIGAAVLAAIIAVLVSTCSSDEDIKASANEKQTKSTATAEQPQKSSTKAAAKNWYDGGTLHNSNGLEWQAASYDNKLATTGDWVAAMVQRNKFKPELQASLTSMDAIKYTANELVKDLDAAFKPESDAELNKQLFTNQGAASTAVMLMMLNGWLTED